MKRGFLIANGFAFLFALISIGWIISEFIIFGILHPKTRSFELLTARDVSLGNFVWFGLLVFLLSHIICFIAIATQVRYFRKPSALGVISFISSIFSCVMLLADWACIHDIFDEYTKHGQAEGEWSVLYRIGVIRGVLLLIIIANLIQAFIRRQKIRTDETAVKDEVVFTLVHSVGIFCGIIGLFFANLAFVTPIVHPLLYFTFPILFVLTLIPYGLLAGYWLVIKLKEIPADWYDEKQFQDISKAGLLSTVATVPFLAVIYILNYNAPKGPIEILWFPFYLYFVMLVFSLTSLYFNRTD
jgi:hypothetical protein